MRVTQGELCCCCCCLLLLSLCLGRCWQRAGNTRRFSTRAEVKNRRRSNQLPCVAFAPVRCLVARVCGHAVTCVSFLICSFRFISTARTTGNHGECVRQSQEQRRCSLRVQRCPHPRPVPSAPALQSDDPVREVQTWIEVRARTCACMQSRAVPADPFVAVNKGVSFLSPRPRLVLRHSARAVAVTCCRCDRRSPAKRFQMILQRACATA